MLMNASISRCPQRWTYYRGQDGYLCGGGHHFISHTDVDRLVNRGIPPLIEQVNGIIDGTRCVPPPAEGWHEYMHWSPEALLEIGKLPMPLKSDGSAWDLRPYIDDIEDVCEELAEAEAYGYGY